MSDKDRDPTSPAAAKPTTRRGRSPAEPTGPAPGMAGEDVGASRPEGAPAEFPPAGAGADIVAPAHRAVVAASEPLQTVESMPELAPGSAAPDRERAEPVGGPEQDGSVNIAAVQNASGKPDSERAPTELAEGPWSDHPDAPAPAYRPPPPPKSGREIAMAALALAVLLPGALYAYLAANGGFDRDDGRISRLESAVATLRATPPPKSEVARGDFDKLAARVDQVDKAVGALAQRQTTAADGRFGDAKDAAEQAKKAAESAASAQSAAAKVAPLEIRVADIEKRLAAFEQAAAGGPKPTSNAPSLLVLSRTVANDLSNGLPYAGELDVLARLGADPKLIEVLKPFADKGAPSPSSLGTEFESELAAARAKVAGSDAPVGLWERVTSVLGHLIRVRSIGADEPGNPAAAVEAALARGDLAAAADGWNSLPVFEKGATPVSGGRIKALAAAHDAARRVSDAALEAIRQAGSAENGG
jgi:hypothetical protein